LKRGFLYAAWGILPRPQKEKSVSAENIKGGVRYKGKFPSVFVDVVHQILEKREKNSGRSPHRKNRKKKVFSSLDMGFQSGKRRGVKPRDIKKKRAPRPQIRGGSSLSLGGNFQIGLRQMIIGEKTRPGKKGSNWRRKQRKKGSCGSTSKKEESPNIATKGPAGKARASPFKRK